MRDHVRRLAVICFGAALCLAFTASAQIFSPLHIFGAGSGFMAPLTQGPDGTLYGVSSGGGAGKAGTIFRLNPDGTHFAILYSFGPGVQFGAVYTNADGYGPVGGMVVSNDVLYGTTEYGGTTGYGTVFKMNTDGSGFSTLHFFTNGVGGGTVIGGLVLGDGALYGVTYSGGTNSGTVFTLNTDGTGFTNLHNFGGTNGTFPMASMILSSGTLYGTTQEGNNGTVFRLDTNGGSFAVLHHFTAPFTGTNVDGDLPESSLVLSGSTLYGTASGGGRGSGTIFAMNTDGSGFTNLYSFTNGMDGAAPVAGLALSGNTLYGVTKSGGMSPGYGTIFRINTDGTGFNSIFDFDGRVGLGGSAPAGALLLSGDTLFGTAGSVVFSINTSATNITVLSNGSDGAQPESGLVLSGDSFYGTTSAGGGSGEGIVFKMGTNGTGFTTLHTFSLANYDPNSGGNYYTNSDGATPLGTLALSGGVLYGTTRIGGTFGVGTVFRVNTDGTDFTNLYNFTNGLDGGEPAAGLVVSGGTLYGTAVPTGSASGGIVFKLNTDGTGYTHLHDFSPLVNGTNSDGDDPLSGLTLEGDMLYGTTVYGGPGGEGTLFKINTNGMGFTNIYSFNTGSFTNVSDGVDPVGGLISSGNMLYGTTSFSITVAHSKGGGGPGTVFKVNTDGTGYVNLHTLTNAFDGTAPKGALVLSGGTLYGTASSGGNGGGGTVFQLDTNGTSFSTLHTFPFQQGTPVGDLVAIGNTVYGTCEYGAVLSASSQPGAGTVFSVTPTVTPSIQFTANPTNGIPPQAVQFSAPGVDDKGNTILTWHWDFGDGTPTFTITYTTNRTTGAISTNYNYTSTQNPLHTYTNNGAFFPSLIAANVNGATNIIGSGPAIFVFYPSSILNGGFETGTFTNWTSGGNFGSQTISTAANYRHSGTYGAQLSSSGSLRYLFQTLSTTPGAVYTISFWMHNPTSKTNNEFQVSWNGNVLLDMTNIPVSAWTNIQLTVTADAGVSVLQFGYRNDTAYFGLDDISLSAMLPPAIASFSLSGANLLLNGAGGLSNRTYYVLMGTNLSEPLDQWVPVATNVPGADGNFSITVTNTVNPSASQRFYLLQLQ